MTSVLAYVRLCSFVVKLTADNVAAGRVAAYCKSSALLSLTLPLTPPCFGVQGSKSGAASLSAQELLSLLRADFSMDDAPQSGVVSEEMLDRLLDRTWMLEDGNSGGESSNPLATAAAAAAAGTSKGSKARGGRLSRSGSKAEVSAADAARVSSTPEPEAAGTASGRLPFPPSGVGYEVVQSLETNVLSNVNN